MLDKTENRVYNTNGNQEFNSACYRGDRHRNKGCLTGGKGTNRKTILQ
jgi:hypothetical protein